MSNALKFFLAGFFSIPLLPVMYVQGRQIRKSVPRLPEARGDEGIVSFGHPTGHYLTLLTVGESTIAGVGVKSHADGFTGTLAEELSRRLETNVQWRVYARSGYTAEKVAEKIIPAVMEDQVELMVIGLGGNDAFQLQSPWQWRKNIHNLITTVRDRYPEAMVVFCQMPPVKEFPAFTPLIKWTVGNLVEMLGDELAEIVEQYDKVYYYDETITFRSWIERYGLEEELPEFFSDGVHPSTLTYQIWAKDVATFIHHQLMLEEVYQ